VSFFCIGSIGSSCTALIIIFDGVDQWTAPRGRFSFWGVIRDLSGDFGAYYHV